MKNLALFFFFINTIINGQNINESFNDCYESGSPLSTGLFASFPFSNDWDTGSGGNSNNCFDGWKEISGSPDVHNWSPFYVPNSNGSYVHSFLSSGVDYKKSETYVLNYEFDLEKKYKISFFAARYGQIESASLVFTSGLVSNYRDSITYHDLPNIPLNSEIMTFTEEVLENDWVLIEFFVDNLQYNYEQLWFRFEPYTDTNGSEIYSHVFIDEFRLEVLSDENSFESVTDIYSCPEEGNKGSIYIYDVPQGTSFEVLTYPNDSNIQTIVFDNSFSLINAVPGDYSIEVNYPNGENEFLHYEIIEKCCEVLECNANFSFNVIDNCQVAFTNISYPNNSLSYSWDFGDGSSYSYTENPVHVFSTNGIYEVKLLVYDQSTGCQDEHVEQVSVSCDIVVDFEQVFGICENVYEEEFLEFCYKCFQDFSSLSDLEDVIVQWDWTYNNETTTFYNNEPFLAQNWPVQPENGMEVCLKITTTSGLEAEFCKEFTACDLEFNDPRNQNKSQINLDSITKIYPNPTDGNFTVEFNAPNDLTWGLYVLSVDGRQIMEIESQEHKNGIIRKKINIEEYTLEKGIYFVRIVAEGQILIKKLILN